jgi:hypothetical protein
MMARQGKPGRKGDTGNPGRRGEKGEKGDAAPTIVNSQIDCKRYTPGPELNLRPLFEAYHAEASEALLAELKQQIEKITRPWHN